MNPFPLRLLFLFAIPLGLLAILHSQEHLFSYIRHGAPSETYCYTGGVRTIDDANSTHSCFTVQDGRFQRVFTPNDGVKEEYEWREGTVLPGFWDGHGHVMMYGEMLGSVMLYGAESIEDVRARIKTYLKTHPNAGSEGSWIKGLGWDQAQFGGIMPTASDLSSDPDLAGLYIMLDRVDAHCTWVSTPVLSLLPSPLPNIPGGAIPTSGVFCDNAMDLPLSVYPQPTLEQRTARLLAAQTELHSFGIVGVHDAGVPRENLELYNDLADAGNLTLRVYAMHECTVRNTFCPEEVRRIEREDGLLTSRSVKLFADGALGSWGAALLDPYTDDPTTSGTLLITGANLRNVTKSWFKHGYQVNIHAIGDLANRLAIQAHMEALATACADNSTSCLADQQTTRRLRIEHAQIIDPADQAKMHAVGIIPSIQPTHATSDSRYVEERLGRERTEGSAYRMRSLLPLHLNLGSDFPVESPDIVAGIRAAVERKGWQGKVFGEAERLEFEQALRGFTRGPAYAAGLEKDVGSVEAGKWADWVVVDRVGLDMKVGETWSAGNRVFLKDE